MKNWLSKYKNGGDISLPNVYPNQMVPKFSNGGFNICPLGQYYDPILKKCVYYNRQDNARIAPPIITGSAILPPLESANNFNKGWLKSPMYNQMIQASIAASPKIDPITGVETSEIPKLRKVLSDPKTMEIERRDLNNPNLGGTTESSPKKGKYNKITVNTKTLIPEREVFGHEILGHATTLGGTLIPYSDVQKIKKYFTPSKKEKLSDPIKLYAKNLGISYKEAQSRIKELSKNPKFAKEWNSIVKEYTETNKTIAESVDKHDHYISDPDETRSRIMGGRKIAKERGIYDPYTQKLTREGLRKLKETGSHEVNSLFDNYTEDEILDMFNTISLAGNTGNQTIAKMGGQLVKQQYGGDISLPNVYPNQMVPKMDVGGNFMMKKFITTTTTTINPNVGIQAKAASSEPSLTADDEITWREGLNEGKQWLKDWYTKRAALPEFTTLANRRLRALDKNYIGYEHIDPKGPDVNATAYYTPSQGKIYFRKKDPYSFSAATILHEFLHGLDDKIPQDRQQRLTKKQLIPEKEWLKTYTGRNANDPDFKYPYHSDPTEVRARLNTFRRRYNIDPTKRYTKEEMQDIINHYRTKISPDPSSIPDFKYQQRSPTSDNDIDQLLDIIGNDPEKLAELNNTIVKLNSNIGNNTARYGGWLDSYETFNKLVNYKKMGGWIDKYKGRNVAKLAMGGQGGFCYDAQGNRIPCPDDKLPVVNVYDRNDPNLVEYNQRRDVENRYINLVNELKQQVGTNPLTHKQFVGLRDSLRNKYFPGESSGLLDKYLTTGDNMSDKSLIASTDNTLLYDTYEVPYDTRYQYVDLSSMNPVYGPSKTLIGYANPKREFYPAKGQYAQGMNKADAELLANQKNLTSFLEQSGVSQPIIMQRYGGLTKFQEGGDKDKGKKGKKSKVTPVYILLPDGTKIKSDTSESSKYGQYIKKFGYTDEGYYDKEGNPVWYAPDYLEEDKPLDLKIKEGVKPMGEVVVTQNPIISKARKKAIERVGDWETWGKTNMNPPKWYYNSGFANSLKDVEEKRQKYLDNVNRTTYEIIAEQYPRGKWETKEEYGERISQIVPGVVEKAKQYGVDAFTPYEPSQLLNNVKGLITLADIASSTSANPYARGFNMAARGVNSLLDAYTAARYAYENQWKNAGVDAIQSVLDLIAYRKGKRTINLSKNSSLPAYYNKLSNTDKIINTTLRTAKGAAAADDFSNTSIGKFLLGRPGLQYKYGGTSDWVDKYKNGGLVKFVDGGEPCPNGQIRVNGQCMPIAEAEALRKRAWERGADFVPDPNSPGDFATSMTLDPVVVQSRPRLRYGYSNIDLGDGLGFNYLADQRGIPASSIWDFTIPTGRGQLAAQRQQLATRYPNIYGDRQPMYYRPQEPRLFNANVSESTDFSRSPLAISAGIDLQKAQQLEAQIAEMMRNNPGMSREQATNVMNVPADLSERRQAFYNQAITDPYEKKKANEYRYEMNRKYAFENQDKGVTFNYDTGDLAFNNDPTAQSGSWGRVYPSALSQTLSLGTPVQYKDAIAEGGVGQVGSESFIELMPVTSQVAASKRLGEFDYFQPNAGFWGNTFGALGLAGDISTVLAPLGFTKIPGNARRWVTTQTPIRNTWKLNPRAGKIPFIEGQPNWLTGWSKDYSDPTKIDFSGMARYGEDFFKTPEGKKFSRLEKAWNSGKLGRGDEAHAKFVEESDRLFRQGQLRNTGLSELFDLNNVFPNGTNSRFVAPLKHTPNTVFKFGKEPFQGDTAKLVASGVGNANVSVPFHVQNITDNELVSLAPRMTGTSAKYAEQIPRSAAAEMAWKLRKLKSQGVYPDWSGGNFLFDPETNKLSVFDLNTTPPNTSFGRRFFESANRPSENIATLMKQELDLAPKGFNNRSGIATSANTKTSLQDAAKFSDSYNIDKTYLDKVTSTDIADYKKYLKIWGHNIEGVTDDQLKRMIAANEQFLQENATGVLKGQTATHVGGIFDQWDPNKLGSHTGDKGFFGAGMYFTPNNRLGTGFTGNSQPYVISGINDPIRFNASPYLDVGYAADQPLAQEVLTKLSENKFYHPVLGNHPEWNNLFHNADSPFDAVIQRSGYRPWIAHTDKELVLQPGVDKPNFWQKSIYGKPEVFTEEGVKRQLTGPGRNLINLSLLLPVAGGVTALGAASMKGNPQEELQQQKYGGNTNWLSKYK